MQQLKPNIRLAHSMSLKLAYEEVLIRSDTDVSILRRKKKEMKLYSFNTMKVNDTRGYPFRGYLPRSYLLRVNFDEGGKPEYPEKIPWSQIQINWNSAHIYVIDLEARI